MQRLGESVKETLDIDFGSTGNDDLEPLGMFGCFDQDLQEDRATLIVATFIESVNDKDESVFWLARKVAKEVKKESALHRPRTQVWIVAKTVCYDGSKRGEDSGEFVDQGRKYISGLAQIRVVLLAEKGSSKLPSIVNACTDRMS